MGIWSAVVLAMSVAVCAVDDDEISWFHVDDIGSYDGDMGLKNDGSGDNGNDDGGGGDCAGTV